MCRGESCSSQHVQATHCRTAASAGFHEGDLHFLERGGRRPHALNALVLAAHWVAHIHHAVPALVAQSPSVACNLSCIQIFNAHRAGLASDCINLMCAVDANTNAKRRLSHRTVRSAPDVRMVSALRGSSTGGFPLQNPPVLLK